MRVFFTASSSGSRQADRERYLQILKVIRSLKHKVSNPYYAATAKEIENFKNRVRESDDIFNTLRKQIINSNCVVAEITVPSTSLGIQIEYALSNKIPVLCLYKKGDNGNLPLMVRDYRNPLIFKKAYTTAEIGDIIKDFLLRVPKTKAKFNMFISHELDKYLSHISKKNKLPKSEIVRRLLQDRMKSDKGYTT